MTPSLRCAIYTRKSSEEGLEQGFNSLDAQRESCAAYILSQAGEGWTALPGFYDDGGYSGGSMERPGIKALIADIDRGLVDVVVVYKVDRLTRSLADFARMVELFDQRKVSFVSVTQAFNTTTSMGRLTLNVLLSFAQFEREVTGERIRDKIAASKAKGLWMGGRPPLGYNGVDLKLVVNPVEADVVRHIFDRYLELGSVVALERDLAGRKVFSKDWVTKAGKQTGGAAFQRGALYHLLANPVYRGAIKHRDKLYANAHPAIIEEAQWDAVQALLAGNCPNHPTTPRLAAPALLRNVLFDDRGSAMAPLHSTRRGRRYRYYASTGASRGVARGSLPRIAMGVIDDFLVECLAPCLNPGWEPDVSIAERVGACLVRVTLGSERILAVLKPASVNASPSVASGTCQRTADAVEVSIAIRLKHRQGALLISAPGAVEGAAAIDRPLVRALCLATNWAERLASGEVGSTKELARDQGLCHQYAAKLMPLAWLAPDLAKLILDGRQPRSMMLGALTREPLPIDWDEQRRLFDTFR